MEDSSLFTILLQSPYRSKWKHMVFIHKTDNGREKVISQIIHVLSSMRIQRNKNYFSHVSLEK